MYDYLLSLLFIMRIGISVSLGQPLWESGRNQTALQLAEMMSALDHTVVFLHSGLHPWWDTYPIPSYATEQSYSEPLTNPLDLLLDIDGILPVPIRKQLASSNTQTHMRMIAFLRTFLQFAEMDASVYLETPISPRSMEYIHEIWCWDVLNPPNTLPSVQTMFPHQLLRTVPFFWSPTLTNHYTKSQRAFAFSPEPIWTIHVAEKNTNESSAVIPLVAIREATRQLAPKGVSYHIHNLDPIKDSRFLKENILGPIELSTLPISLAPKVPFHEWTKTANHLFFSHSRFTPLRISLLSLIWMGVPLFHNSPVLRDLHPTLETGYYSGNTITEWIRMLEQFLKDPSFWWKNQKERRAALLQRFSLPVHRDAWRRVMDSFSSPPPSPSPLSPSQSQQNAPASSAAIHILFSDMWPGFNPQTNFILDTLRHHAPHLTIYGTLSLSQQEPDLVIVGPYSDKWRSLSLPSSVQKIFFSAENWAVPTEQKDPFALYLLSSPDPTNPRHFRLPVWMTFIDWFTTSTSLPLQTTDNPIRLPLHFATQPHPISFKDRPEFCAFVVSNPTQPFRNEAFHALNQYKPVNSGGALYNNMGGALALLYPGGGGGDLSKHDFFTKHRFTLSAENAQRKGYITEKVLHAKMAGAIPLYWGDADAQEDFAPNSLVNLSHLTSPKDIVPLVQRLEAHPEFCSRIAATPLLNSEKTANALALLHTMSERILSLLPRGPKELYALSAPSAPFASIRVINLDRRRDRWDALLQAEPFLASSSHVIRLSAVDGKTLTLTPSLYRLFQHNTFHWKKGVIGCNLSHMMAWSAIQKEEQQENSYHLVLEDDVRFAPDWQTRWVEALPHIPTDAELLYLGGVLPPNQSALPLALSSIHPYWSRIQPNTFFTPTPAPVFHFCAYSYVLTPAGARKLMNHLRHSTEKYYTVSDHMLGSPLVGLTTYVMTPLVTHCFQEDDPAYRSSQFNQLQRTDTFDSDLWNNTDAFVPPSSLTTVYYLPKPNSEPPLLYEHTWLEDMLQTMIELQPFPVSSEPLDPSAWCLVQRPHATEWLPLLKERHTPLRLLHLSDEFGSDQTEELYSLPNVKRIVRTYPSGSPIVLDCLRQLPLGYHYKATKEQASLPFSQRPFIWSFHGTEWYDRRAQLAPLLAPDFQPSELRLQPDWAHPTASSEADYLHALTQSKFCPILRGNHPETFRFYEVLEGNTLPVTTITDRVFVETVEKELSLSELYPWTRPEEAMRMLLACPEEGDRIQELVRKRWEEWKERIRTLFAS